MYNTKFDGNDLSVIIEEPVQKELMMRGIGPIEVCRLIESFAAKITASKKNELLQITNDDTGASLALDIRWESDTKVSVQVSIVNLDNLNVQEKPRSKVNLADPPEAQPTIGEAAELAA